ncbi:hypothetical protein GYH30_044035 [Glycine max]|nr:hypothetical protein GYH30_044035 [Glycine max]
MASTPLPPHLRHLHRHLPNPRCDDLNSLCCHLHHREVNNPHLNITTSPFTHAITTTTPTIARTTRQPPYPSPPHRAATCTTSSNTYHHYLHQQAPS